MNKIILSTDLGTDKDLVIETGLTLAKHLNASVELLNIINENIEYMPVDISMDVSSYWETQKYASTKALEEIKNNHKDLAIEVVVLVGDPNKSIIEHAIEKHASIIVMGTHGRTGISHLVMGSTAEYTIRHSPIPVLVVPMNRQEH